MWLLFEAGLFFSRLFVPKQSKDDDDEIALEDSLAINKLEQKDN
jgi:Sec-independent protein secretion pathway component TatC